LPGLNRVLATNHAFRVSARSLFENISPSCSAFKRLMRFLARSSPRSGSPGLSWREENQKVANLTDALAQSVKDREAGQQHVVSLTAALAEKAEEQAHKTLNSAKRGSVNWCKLLTSLRASEREVRNWLDLTDNKWGMAPPSVKLLPDDWGNVVYIAGMVSDEVRSDLDSLSQKLSEANSLIGRFLGMQVNFRNQRLMPPAHVLLSESAPLLSKAISAVEAYETSLR
jgi:hypothetical protein